MISWYGVRHNTAEAFVRACDHRPIVPSLSREKKIRTTDWLKNRREKKIRKKYANSLLKKTRGVFVVRRSPSLYRPPPTPTRHQATLPLEQRRPYTIVVDQFIFLRFSSRRAAIATGMEDPRRRESRFFIYFFIFRSLISPTPVDNIDVRGVPRARHPTRGQHHERSGRSLRV